jgi:hypothetical protein
VFAELGYFLITPKNDIRYMTISSSPVGGRVDIETGNYIPYLKNRFTSKCHYSYQFIFSLFVLLFSLTVLMGFAFNKSKGPEFEAYRW